VLHFDSSVKGLNVGSPVRFRGVKIGQVKDINVRVKPGSYEFRIPVVIEIEPSRIGDFGSEQGILESIKTSMQGTDPIQTLVEKGLRAQLELDSLVTGQLYVDFDMHPEAPATISGDQTDYPELPTMRSSLGELTKTFEDLPLRELSNKLISSAEGIEKLVNAPGLHQGLAKFDDTMTQLNSLLKNLNQELLPLARSLRQTLKETRRLVARVDGKVDPLVNQFNQAMDSFDAAAQETRKTMLQVQNFTADDSRLQQQLSITLREVNKAARSIHQLSAEIEREPQILLRGRNSGETK
jgi:paraquat-inducible protein B